MGKTWIQTWTGRKFDVINPRVEDIDVQDIARGLSHLCRYTGQSKFYTVAEHSIYVAQLASGYGRDRSLMQYGLLHDAAEAYVGDLNHPTKHSGRCEGYREIEHAIQAKIYERFGLISEPPEIKYADTQMRWPEGEQCFPKGMHPDWARDWTDSAKFTRPEGIHIMFLSPEFARSQWLFEFNRFFPGMV